MCALGHLPPLVLGDEALDRALWDARLLLYLAKHELVGVLFQG